MNQTTTKKAVTTAADSIFVASVCPNTFVDFYKALQSTLHAIKINPEISDDRRDELALKTALSFGLELYGEDQAVPLASRILALNKTVDGGALRDVGRRLFGDPEHLVDKKGVSTLILGVAVVASAVADLRYSSDQFTADDFSTAILTIRAGCPIDNCPDRVPGPYEAEKNPERTP